MHIPNSDQIRANVEESFSRAFSGDSISLIKLLALISTLVEIEGVSSFTTRLPWQIETQDGQLIEGLSENLKFAAKDISSQIQRMLDSGVSAETIIALSVSEARLQTVMPSLLPVGMVNA